MSNSLYLSEPPNHSMQAMLAFRLATWASTLCYQTMTVSVERFHIFRPKGFFKFGLLEIWSTSDLALIGSPSERSRFFFCLFFCKRGRIVDDVMANFQKSCNWLIVMANTVYIHKSKRNNWPRMCCHCEPLGQFQGSLLLLKYLILF